MSQYPFQTTSQDAQSRPGAQDQSRLRWSGLSMKFQRCPLRNQERLAPQYPRPPASSAGGMEPGRPLPRSRRDDSGHEPHLDRETRIASQLRESGEYAGGRTAGMLPPRNSQCCCGALEYAIHPSKEDSTSLGSFPRLKKRHSTPAEAISTNCSQPAGVIQLR